MTEYELSRYRVVCHTIGCENADVPIDVLADRHAPVVVCGPCGLLLDDLTPLPTQGDPNG